MPHPDTLDAIIITEYNDLMKVKETSVEEEEDKEEDENEGEGEREKEDNTTPTKRNLSPQMSPVVKAALFLRTNFLGVRTMIQVEGANKSKTYVTPCHF